MNLKPLWIYLEDGTFGYQEIMSDPSYAGQFVVFTMPEIGIVGINDDDMESKGVHASGMIVRNYNPKHSSFRAQDSLGSMLVEHDALGICDIDTKNDGSIY